jgi:hypothetical protein
MKGKPMSKQTREFFEQLKAGEKPSLLEKMQERLFPSTIGGELWKELKQQGLAGAHEMAAALFNGNAFVMYPRQPDHDDPQQAQTKEVQQEQQRGGREM